MQNSGLLYQAVGGISLTEFIPKRRNTTIDRFRLTEEIFVGHTGDKIANPCSSRLFFDIRTVKVVEKVHLQRLTGACFQMLEIETEQFPVAGLDLRHIFLGLRGQIDVPVVEFFQLSEVAGHLIAESDRD